TKRLSRVMTRSCFSESIQISGKQRTNSRILFVFSNGRDRFDNCRRRTYGRSNGRRGGKRDVPDRIYSRNRSPAQVIDADISAAVEIDDAVEKFGVRYDPDPNDGVRRPYLPGPSDLFNFD